MICGSCQTALPDGSRYCLSCGADLSDPGGSRAPLDTVAEIRRHLLTVLAGNYRLRDVLGRGGMGTVFLGDDLKLERQVAIKVLPPRLATEPQFVSRFVREARTAARLEHRHIIPIYSVHDDPVMPFFVMKYVSGRSLQDLIAEQPVPIALCQRILVEAASALGHAHAKGVVHRDVKPSNIMLDESDHVLLGDFGISKALEANTALTGTGQLVGTPAYMSPEQIKGQTLDGRSDQYSLAVVGHQLLTGRPLFDVSTSNAALFQHVNEPPRSTRELRPDVPEALAAALLKALAKDPRDRFDSMAAFAAAVWPEGVSMAGSTSSFPRFGARRRWNQAHAFVVAAAAAVVAAIGLAMAAWPRPASEGDSVRQTGTASVPRGDTTSSASPARVRARDSTGGSATQPGAKSESSQSNNVVRPTAPTRSSGAPSDTKVIAPAMGYVTIDAQPYGTLAIDNVDIGDTPIVLRAVTPGSHVFRVTRDGYKAWSETMAITAGNIERRRITLVPLQP